jgi:hypothetical protein
MNEFLWNFLVSDLYLDVLSSLSLTKRYGLHVLVHETIVSLLRGP